jgi:hypothetical protein
MDQRVAISLAGACRYMSMDAAALRCGEVAAWLDLLRDFGKNLNLKEGGNVPNICTPPEEPR